MQYYAIANKQRVVQKIDEDSRQLVNALMSETSMIITTVQKFLFVTATIDKLNNERSNDDTLALTTKIFDEDRSW